MEIEETKTQSIEKDKSILGVYSSDLRESFERQSANDALHLRKIPGMRRRWINEEYRARTGNNNFWQKDDPSVCKKVGDLVSAFVPEDLAKKRQTINYEKGVGRIAKDQEKRRELAERIYRDSDEQIQMNEGLGNEKFKRKGQTKYFYGK